MITEEQTKPRNQRTSLNDSEHKTHNLNLKTKLPKWRKEKRKLTQPELNRPNRRGREGGALYPPNQSLNASNKPQNLRGGRVKTQ